MASKKRKPEFFNLYQHDDDEGMDDPKLDDEVGVSAPTPLQTRGCELRRRPQGPVKNQAENLNASVRISSDDSTREVPQKSLRKNDNLDFDALEAEARSTGLGASDPGSCNDSKRQAAKEEEERNGAERRKSAYQSSFPKADEASRALRMEQVVTRVAKTLTGPEAVAHLAFVITNNQAIDAQNSIPADASYNKTQKSYDENMLMEEDEVPQAFEEKKDDAGGWTELVHFGKGEQQKSEYKEDVVRDKTHHEVPVGKGLSGVLKFLRGRGTFRETNEWGGRTIDNKKVKLVDQVPREPLPPLQIRAISDLCLPIRPLIREEATAYFELSLVRPFGFDELFGVDPCCCTVEDMDKNRSIGSMIFFRTLITIRRLLK